jgi:uncharacterized protein involved in type VI secretion and phage assembly
LDIKIDGNPYDDYNFLNIEWTQELLKPNEFKFVMQKKNFHKEEDDVSFKIAKELIGKTIACKIQTQRFDEKAEQKNEEMEFEGIVFNIEVSRSDMTAEVLIRVTAYSPDYLLMDNKQTHSSINKTLNTIVEETVAPYNFKKQINPRFTDDIPYCVQYNESHYDFLVRLARRYGEWLYYDGKELVFGKLKEALPALELFARTDILSYRHSAKITHDKFRHVYYDYLKYERTIKKTEQVDTSSGDGLFIQELKAQSQALYKKETWQNLHSAVLENNPADVGEISVKAQFLGDKAEMSVCSGATVRTDLQIGKRFKIKDFYDKSNNRTGTFDHEELFVYKVTHKAQSNGYYENVFSAISGKCEYPPYHDSDVYPVAPTQIGFVKDNRDPEKLGRVRVLLNWNPDEEERWTPWIRISQPHGGFNKGFYYIPEITEEVMVGFENGNAEKPYVIGSVYDGEQHPDKGKWYSDTNDIKAIRTRNGHTIEIHDQNDDGFIRIYDNEKDTYVLTFSTDKKLIRLESKGNIELFADADIVMQAGNDIRMLAGNDMKSVANKNMTESAGENLSITVGASADITIGNNLSIKTGSDAMIESGNNLTLQVANDLVNRVDNDCISAIQGDQNTKIDGNRNEHIMGNIEQKADGLTKIDAGASLDLFATKVNIN